MTEPKFTPGPWRIDGSLTPWVMAGHLHIATIVGCLDGNWRSANAFLMVTAPELYAELARIDPANPVLAKARGETPR